ncbi:sulfotransferase family protein [Actinocorallia populi]|uniref:sulfotransferase family protein n=1 Tax=Actinocorallia populi TaxID=2079200 RepID=UPI000D097596|nr:sulfotransferase [Actinocorallia populi]
MRQTPHILVVNGTKVHRPVFLLGAPHSGTDLVARALRHSPGVHVTRGRPAVTKLVYAFARRPSIATERGRGAARVLRDAYAESWQLARHGCRDCPAECWELSGYTPGDRRPGGPCTDPAEPRRFADASPDLIYSADVLLDAFPDAQLVQVIRDGRDAVAGMLGDERVMAWFKPGILDLDEVFPHPFLGLDDPAWRYRWPAAAPAIKCALRWRGAVRLSATLRAQVPEEQLLTLRYEDLVADPLAGAHRLSDYLRERVSGDALAFAAGPHPDDPRPLPALPGEEAGDRRAQLTARQTAQVEKIAGRELRTLGYLPNSEED